MPVAVVVAERLVRVIAGFDSDNRIRVAPFGKRALGPRVKRKIALRRAHISLSAVRHENQFRIKPMLRGAVRCTDRLRYWELMLATRATRLRSSRGACLRIECSATVPAMHGMGVIACFVDFAAIGANGLSGRIFSSVGVLRENVRIA